jgi:hypothetical protein
MGRRGLIHMLPDTCKTTGITDIRFSYGSFTFAVGSTQADADGEVNHIMGSLTSAVTRAVAMLDEDFDAVSALEPTSVTVTSNRSMTIHDTTMIVELSLTVNHEIAAYRLAALVDQMLSETTHCVVHVLDPEAFVATMAAGVRTFLAELLGDTGASSDMPSRLKVIYFGGSTDFPGPSTDGPTATTADDEPNTGQYL